MHQAQRIAILAMIQTVESQLHAIRGLMGFDESIAKAPVVPTQQPNETAYMSDEEETKIDSDLEKARADALSESDIIQRRWLAQRKSMDEALEGSVL